LIVSVVTLLEIQRRRHMLAARAAELMVCVAAIIDERLDELDRLRSLRPCICPSRVVDEDVIHAGPGPSPRVDELASPARTLAEWTAAERKHFREVQSEVTHEHDRSVVGYRQHHADLLKGPMFGEPPENPKKEKSDTEKDWAFEYFRVTPDKVLRSQRAAKRELDRIARTLAYQLDRSEPEVRRRLATYRKDFLRLHAK
jgi:hypothetical protein